MLKFLRNSAHCGAVAQLGARLDGIEEVEGSNPFGSTKFDQLEIERLDRRIPSRVTNKFQ